MKTDDAPDFIEILDDDTSAFGGSPGNQTIDDTGGRRWIAPVAVAALVGLIVYGVASSSSSPGTPDVAPATSTPSVTPTTKPSPTTTVPAAPPVPYYAAELPREYKLQYVEMQPGDSRISVDGNYQLWASPGASGSTGSWFSLGYASGAGEIFAQDAYKLQSDRGSLAITHLHPGHVGAQLTTADGTSFVTAYGWTDDEVVRLIESIDVDPGGRPVITDPTLTEGYELISTIAPWTGVQGNPLEWVGYAPTLDPDTSVTISVSKPADIIGASVVPDRQVLLRFMLDHATSFSVDGHTAVAGQLVEQPGYSMATWDAGDHIVTVTSGMAVPDLIAIARTVHTVARAEWDGMKFQAQRNGAEANGNNVGDYSETQPVPVSFGTDAAGNAWTIRVSTMVYGAQPMINWELAGGGFGMSPTDGAEISTFVTSDRTYVVADLPRTVAAVADLHITLPGRDPVVVPFNDTDATLDRTFAAYAFTELGPFTAEIVAPDGTVLARWPSW